MIDCFWNCAARYREQTEQPIMQVDEDHHAPFQADNLPSAVDGVVGG
jgi:hypothetical protein